MFVEGAGAWKLRNAVVLPILEDGTSDRDLPSCKPSFLDFLLTTLAAGLFNRRREVVDTANAVRIWHVVHWLPNITDEEMNPVWLAVVDAKPAGASDKVLVAKAISALTYCI